MKSLQAIKLILLPLIILTLWSCSSDKLSREKAEKIIKEKIQFPKDEIKAFIIEDATVGMGIRAKTFQKLQDEGMLTYTYDPSAWSGGAYANLTEQGKQYAVSSKYATNNKFEKKINIKVAKLEFGEITGIIENKESNIAVVKYTFIRKDITPFGRIEFDLKEGVFNTNASFTKYDDGWRINLGGKQ